MSYIDARGVRQDFDVAASVGICYRYTVNSDGSPRDLTGESIIVVVKDDRSPARNYGGENGSETTYQQTITDAANGVIDFEIPASEFTQKEGGRLSYEMRVINAAGKPSGLMHGYLNVWERG